MNILKKMNEQTKANPKDDMKHERLGKREGNMENIRRGLSKKLGHHTWPQPDHTGTRYWAAVTVGRCIGDISPPYICAEFCYFVKVITL